MNRDLFSKMVSGDSYIICSILNTMDVNVTIRMQLMTWPRCVSSKWLVGQGIQGQSCREREGGHPFCVEWSKFLQLLLKHQEVVWNVWQEVCSTSKQLSVLFTFPGRLGLGRLESRRNPRRLGGHDAWSLSRQWRLSVLIYCFAIIWI